MIEGVLRDRTDMKVDRQCTDTHGAPIVGFAFDPVVCVFDREEVGEYLAPGAVGAASMPSAMDRMSPGAGHATGCRSGSGR